MNEKFDVTGMSCSACSSHVEKSVSKLEGIKTVSVNLLTNSMQVEYDETKLDTGKIIEAVEHAGYGASVKEDGKAAVKAGETEDAVSIQQKNITVSYTHLTLPTKRIVENSVVAVPIKKKKEREHKDRGA